MTKKANVILTKIANEEKTYPGTRAYQTTNNILGGGLPGALYSRGMAHRALKGTGGITAREKAIIQKMHDAGAGEAHPIAAALTSLPGAAALTGAQLGIMGGMMGGKKGVRGAAVGATVGAAYGALSGALGMALGRGLYSRAAAGRGRVGRSGIYKNDPEIYKAAK